METVENKYITVAYKLYTMEDGEKELFEEAKAEHPFQFISGLGTTLEDFENQITALSKGDKSTVLLQRNMYLVMRKRKASRQRFCHW